MPQEHIETQVLHVCKPIGEVFINGLSSYYDDTYPDITDSQLSLYITEKEYTKAMTKINDALTDLWPCLPCTSFAKTCCICTCGLSLYCSIIQIREAEMRTKMQIERINKQSNFKAKHIEFRLVRIWYRHVSYIEICYVPDPENQSTIASSCISESQDDSANVN